MIKNKLVLLVVALMLYAAPRNASAHGGGDHFMSTIKTVEAGSISLETKDQKVIKVAVDASTKFEKTGAAATVRDLLVGQRVVVHTKKGGEPPVAVLIKLGEAPQSPAPPTGAKN